MKCRFCKSQKVVKGGIRKNKNSTIQRYLCKDCRRKFTENKGFLYVEDKKRVILVAIDLYFKNVSLRRIQQHLKQFYDVKVSHVSILKWLKKYISMIKQYTDIQKIKSSSSCNADETLLYFRGNQNYMWNFIDGDSRYMVSFDLTARLVNYKTWAKPKERQPDSAIFLAKIDDRGRISVPAELRKALFLRYQTSVEVKIRRDKI